MFKQFLLGYMFYIGAGFRLAPIYNFVKNNDLESEVLSLIFSIVKSYRKTKRFTDCQIKILRGIISG
jgi:hypothetical protein